MLSTPGAGNSGTLSGVIDQNVGSSGAITTEGTWP